MLDEVVQKDAVSSRIDVDDVRIRAVARRNGPPAAIAGRERAAACGLEGTDDESAGDAATEQSPDERPRDDPEVDHDLERHAFGIDKRSKRNAKPQQAEGRDRGRKCGPESRSRGRRDPLDPIPLTLIREPEPEESDP